MPRLLKDVQIERERIRKQAEWSRSVQIESEAKYLYFLRLLSECGNVKHSAEFAGLQRSALYSRRRTNAQFAEAWDAALELGNAAIEDEIRRRAIEGIEEPIVYKGEIQKDENGKPITVRKYSDNLLMFLAKGTNPDKWRDKPAVVNASASAAASSSASIDVEVKQGREGMYSAIIERVRAPETVN